MAITKRDNDKYQIDIIVGYDLNGKRIRHTETIIGKKKDAIARGNEVKAFLKKGIYTKPNKLTFDSFIDDWWNDYATKQLAPKTIEGYKNLLIRIKKLLGYYKLEEINPILLNNFYNNLRNIKEPRKLSEKTIRHYYGLINSLMNYAVQMQYIDRNSNLNINPPKVTKKEMKYYDLENINKLVLALESEPIKNKCLILLALDSGARRGEITGIEWEDIDFTKGTLKIDKVTQVFENKIIEKAKPKNNSSIRIIDLTSTTLNALKDYQEFQFEQKQKHSNKWGNSKKVFTTNDGFNMYPSTPTAILKKIIAKNNLPELNFHSLRHTSASMQLSGVKPQDYIKVSKRIGHNSLSTTLDVYSHIIDNDTSDIIDKLNNILK